MPLVNVQPQKRWLGADGAAGAAGGGGGVGEFDVVEVAAFDGAGVGAAAADDGSLAPPLPTATGVADEELLQPNGSRQRSRAIGRRVRMARPGVQAVHQPAPWARRARRCSCVATTRLRGLALDEKKCAHA